MKAALLTREAIDERELERQVINAIRRLEVRARNQTRRAIRAPIGSNERKVAAGQAKHMKACAQLLASEREWQEAMLKSGALTDGWRKLADTISALWRDRERHKLPKAEAS